MTKCIRPRGNATRHDDIRTAALDSRFIRGPPLVFRPAAISNWLAFFTITYDGRPGHRHTAHTASHRVLVNPDECHVVTVKTMLAMSYRAVDSAVGTRTRRLPSRVSRALAAALPTRHDRWNGECLRDRCGVRRRTIGHGGGL